jgi:predicted nucleic acid-binding protein
MGAGLPGAEEVRRASWILVQPNVAEPAESAKAACSSLGKGERNAIYLALDLVADLILIDEHRARRVARVVGLAVAGSIALLERAAELK